MPILSIIIPIYNAERTLRRCVESVLSQSFGDWELILVDDGSQDGTPGMCDEYSGKDERIRVIHKENGGASSARNAGIEVMSGEWMTFIDSDDEIGEGYFDDFAGSEKECDLMIGHYKIFMEATGKEIFQVIPAGKYVGGDALRAFYERYINFNVMKGPNCKFFRRELVGANRFNVGQKIGEDVVFVQRYLQKVKSIEMLQNTIYLFYKGAVVSQVKYAQPLELAAKYMRYVFDEYRKLGIHSMKFELDQFRFFKSLAPSEIDDDPSLWYSNPDVRKVWSLVKRNYSRRDQLHISLYTCRLFGIVRNIIKKATSLFI